MSAGSGVVAPFAPPFRPHSPRHPFIFSQKRSPVVPPPPPPCKPSRLFRPRFHRGPGTRCYSRSHPSHSLGSETSRGRRRTPPSSFVWSGWPVRFRRTTNRTTSCCCCCCRPCCRQSRLGQRGTDVWAVADGTTTAAAAISTTTTTTTPARAAAAAAVAFVGRPRRWRRRADLTGAPPTAKASATV